MICVMYAGTSMSAGMFTNAYTDKNTLARYLDLDQPEARVQVKSLQRFLSLTMTDVYICHLAFKLWLT